MGLGNLLDPYKMKRHLLKERELNDTPYGLRVLTKGTTANKLAKKVNTTVQQVMRQKRRIHREEAVAHLDSFFTEVSGLQRKSSVDENVNFSTFTVTKNRPKNQTSSAKNETSKAARQLSTTKHHVKKVEIKMKRRQNGPVNNSNTLDKSRRPSKIISMQETLNHKNCFALEEESKFNSIWMGSDADWTTLNINLGMDPADALKQAEKALEHYRTNLNDFWNIHGLTAGQGYGVDGQPWCTSHYSFHLVLWHIPLALSGQRYSAVEQKLTFEPKLKVPFALPFFTPFASGTVQAKKLNGRIKYMVTVTSGKLEVILLAVSKSMLPKTKVSLSQGEYVSWERK